MSVNKKLKKGFDINLVGKAEKKTGKADWPETFAIKPDDFMGLQRVKVLVKPGMSVKAGTPLFYDKTTESVMYSSPVSGEVAEVKRGAKRKLLEIRILADKEVEFESFDKFSVSELNNLGKEQIVDQMTKSGVWPNLIQRPYAVIAKPEDTPKAIFISGFDTNPLAPDYNFIFKGQEKYFEAGIKVLKKLTAGKVHLNLDAKKEIPSTFSKVQGVQVNKFSGPHPAGNVGVQIHHIDPINKDEIAWTINPYGVIQIGKLFLEGKYDASKVIALCGSEVAQPQYYEVMGGTNIGKLIDGKVKGDNFRIISGNVLTGTKVSGDGYLGFYDQMVTIIPEGDYHEFLGWILPSAKKLSVHRSFGLLSSLMGKNKEYVVDTNMKGQERAFVLTNVFEKYLPMDVYPVYLLKAIMAEDYNEMEALGIYEVAEEDFALCEFVDVSKMEVQKIIRQGLDLMRLG